MLMNLASDHPPQMEKPSRSDAPLLGRREDGQSFENNRSQSLQTPHAVSHDADCAPVRERFKG